MDESQVWLAYRWMRWHGGAQRSAGMPQLQLPMFARGVTCITQELGYEKRDGRVTYFCGSMPVFSHAEGDLATFRMITSQFCVNGNCSQPDIVRAFGVPLSTVKRYCSLYRKQGIEGFYAPRARRGPAVLTEAVVGQAQERLDEGQDALLVAQALGIRHDTLRKAIRAGKLHARKKKTSQR
jgi:transposase